MSLGNMGVVDDSIMSGFCRVPYHDTRMLYSYLEYVLLLNSAKARVSV